MSLRRSGSRSERADNRARPPAGVPTRPSGLHRDFGQDPSRHLRRRMYRFPQDLWDRTRQGRKHQNPSAYPKRQLRLRDKLFFLTCVILDVRGPNRQPTNLYPIRSAVENENRREFVKLREEAYTFQALDDARGGYARSVMAERVSLFVFASRPLSRFLTDACGYSWRMCRRRKAYRSRKALRSCCWPISTSNVRH